MYYMLGVSVHHIQYVLLVRYYLYIVQLIYLRYHSLSHVWYVLSRSISVNFYLGEKDGKDCCILPCCFIGRYIFRYYCHTYDICVSIVCIFIVYSRHQCTYSLALKFILLGFTTNSVHPNLILIRIRAASISMCQLSDIIPKITCPPK